MPKLKALLSNLIPASADAYFQRLMQALNGPDDFFLTPNRNVLAVDQLIENQHRVPGDQSPLSQQYFDWLTHIDFFNLSSFNLEIGLFLLTCGLYYYAEVYKEERKRLHNSEAYLRAKIKETYWRYYQAELTDDQLTTALDKIKKEKGLNVKSLAGNEEFKQDKKVKDNKNQAWRDVNLNIAERLFVKFRDTLFAKILLTTINAINIYTMSFWVIYMFAALHGIPVYSLVSGVLFAGILTGGIGFAVFLFAAPAVLALLYVGWKLWEAYHPKPEKTVETKHARREEKANLQALKMYRIQMDVERLTKELEEREKVLGIDSIELPKADRQIATANPKPNVAYMPHEQPVRHSLHVKMARLKDFITGYLIAQFACWPPLAFIGLFTANPAIAIAFTLGSFIIALMVGAIYATRAGVNVKEQNAKFVRLLTEHNATLDKIKERQAAIDDLKKEVSRLKQAYHALAKENYELVNEKRKQFEIEEEGTEEIPHEKKWKFNPADERQRRTLEVDTPVWTWIKKGLGLLRTFWSSAGTMAFIVRNVLFPGGVFLTLAGLFSLTIPISWPVLLGIALGSAVLWGAFSIVKQRLDNQMAVDIKFMQEHKVVLANVNYRFDYLQCKKKYYEKLNQIALREKEYLQKIVDSGKANNPGLAEEAKPIERPKVKISSWQKKGFLGAFFKGKKVYRVRIENLPEISSIQHSYKSS